MQIDQAGAEDVPALARLLILMAGEGNGGQATRDAFAADLSIWWTAHQTSHSAFVARLDGPEIDGPEMAPEIDAPELDGPEIVGMAWVALVPRVPRPNAMNRTTADIQSVFVVPEHRGRGIGSALVSAASEHATCLGASRVTVHSGTRAVPLYERLGFESSRKLLQKPLD